jgi:hypothetical protein
MSSIKSNKKPPKGGDRGGGRTMMFNGVSQREARTNILAFALSSTMALPGPGRPMAAPHAPWYDGFRDPDDECTRCGQLPDRCDCWPKPAPAAPDPAGPHTCAACGVPFTASRSKLLDRARGKSSALYCTITCARRGRALTIAARRARL